MKIIHSQTPEELGKMAAKHAADLLRQYISKNGSARLLMSTGASQLTTINALIDEELEWSKVEMFHLDEYINLPKDHPASFIKYLQERFVDKVNLKKVHFVDTWGDIDVLISNLNNEISTSPIDVALIGIGENAHIAFNDPPADFETEDPFIIVKLAESCRRQQLGEGWFAALEDVPSEAVTISVKQILKSKHIISAVPFKVKAQAIYDTLNAPEITPIIPSTAMRGHSDVTIYVDEGSSSMLRLN